MEHVTTVEKIECILAPTPKIENIYVEVVHNKKDKEGGKNKMGKTVVRVTSSKADAIQEKNWINKNMKKRGIKREAYVGEISQAYVKERTREGYPVRKKNYAIFMRNTR